MRSAFDLLVFPNSIFTQIFILKGYVLFGEIAPKNNHYYYYCRTYISKFVLGNGFFKSIFKLVLEMDLFYLFSNYIFPLSS